MQEPQTIREIGGDRHGGFLSWSRGARRAVSAIPIHPGSSKISTDR
jgi:hypothetical protein